jgi:hypothetical protein
MLTRRKLVFGAASLPLVSAGIFRSDAFSQDSPGPPPPQAVYGIRAQHGQFLTAVNGGGLKGCLLGSVLSSNRTAIGPWETFKFIWRSKPSLYGTGLFALQTFSNNYVTAVNGGGLGGANDCSAPFHTNATSWKSWEHFTIFPVDTSKNLVALLTDFGNYVTAINGGGIGGPNDSSSIIHTDAIQIREWETFGLFAP